MEENFDKALAKKIRYLAEENNAEPYEIGAWEDFENQVLRSKTNIFRFLWIGLAASFLMAMSVNTIYNSSNFDGLKNSPFSFKAIEEATPSMLENNSLNASVDHQQKFSENPSQRTVVKEGSSDRARLVHFNSRNGRFLMGSLFPETFLNPEIQVNNSYYTAENQIIKYSSGFIPMEESGNSKRERKNQNDIKVGVVLASGINSINRNKNGCTIGAGVLTDIPLFKGLALNTGLVFSAQRLNYDSYLSGEKVKTTGKLVSVDLPVNIKYNVCQKSDKQFFVSAGVSSLAYIKESFRQDGQVAEGAVNNYNEDSFSGLDIAKFLNLSMGVEIPLEKEFTLLIEPYLKYPLGNTTSQEIKYASGGLSFRLNMGLALLN